MKSAKIESKKIAKVAQPRRVAGVPLRSGVKAGIEFMGPGGPAPERPGLFGHKVDKYGKNIGI
jgi:hypothetical protein